ncbi:tail fiber protein [Paenibacillus sp. AN1007]|uniref:Tail fiber protein n=1 Tax=Paenibacillus sp. AN1007 TaxID=3151385 RepID=A0AAU8NI16_9BACL
MYNKQEWKDEIPDLTKPILDPSTGKQKTDPQTGRPLFELVQEGTRITSTRLNTIEDGIDAAHTLVELLAKEIAGNFVAVVDGLMGLACTATGLKVTWTAGVAYVGGRRYEVTAGEMSLNPTQGQYLYVDVDGVVKKTTSQTTAKSGLSIFYVATDTGGVITAADQRVNVNLEEILKKIENLDLPDASLTVKGKVQLSNNIASQSQTVAATSKAVDDARTSAMSASLPRTGGSLTGPLRISSWGEVSASTGGYVLYGHNCYLDASGVVYRYRNTHETMGARGIVFRLGAGLEGAWMFDTGQVAVTAGASFTPRLKRILNTDDYNGIVQDYIRQPGYANTTGSGTAYAVTLNPVPASLLDGFGITIVPHVTNSAGVTLNVNGLGDIPLKKQDGSAYAAGEMLAGKPYSFRFIEKSFLADSGSKEVINGTTDYEVILNEDVNKGDFVRLVNTTIFTLSDRPPVSTIYSTRIKVSTDGKTLVASNGYNGSAGPVFNIGDNGELTPYTVSPNFTGGISGADVWGDYLAASVNYVLTIFKRTNGVYTKITGPDVPPPSMQSISNFTPDGKYLIVTLDSDTSPNWCMYKRNGDTFTKMPNVNIGRPGGTKMSPNGGFLGARLNGTKTVGLVKIGQDTLIPISQYELDSTLNVNHLEFTADSNNIIGATNGKPIVLSIKADGSLVRKDINDTMGGWTANMGYTLAASPDGKLAVASKRFKPNSVIGVIGIENDSFSIYPDAPISLNLEITYVAYSPDSKYIYIVTEANSADIKIHQLRAEKKVIATKVNGVNDLNGNADVLGIGYAKAAGKKGSLVSITRIF